MSKSRSKKVKPAQSSTSLTEPYGARIGKWGAILAGSKNYSKAQSFPRIDRVPRYAPQTVHMLGRGEVPVIRYHIYPSGRHPKSCHLTPTGTAVEFVTPYGSRWRVFENAWINSELRLVVKGFGAGDEVVRSWPVVKDGLKEEPKIPVKSAFRPELRNLVTPKVR